MKEIEEFKKLKYERDEYYFKIGFASYNVYWRKKTFYVNAIYREEALMKNEQTNDYTNGIKEFEILDQAYRLIKKIKVPKGKKISLRETEDYIMANC